jgi:GTPase SAR1 family protein
VFILCYSVVHPDSFHNIKQKWLDELRRSSPDTPFILVGTKTDMRDDPDTVEKLRDKGKDVISLKEGQKRAKEIKAKFYLECSAKDLKTVNEVFRMALRVVMDPVKAQKKVVEKLAKKEIKEEAKEMKKQQKLMVKAEKAKAKSEKGGKDETEG